NFNEPVTTTVSEDLFQLIKRNFDPNYDIKEHLPAPRGIELKTNIMPINRFVWTQNAGIITDGLKEAEIYKNSLSITLLRATKCISNPKNPARGTPAGPPLETPDLQMKGLQKAFFAISFVEKPENLYEICDNIFNPPILVFADLRDTKFVSTDNSNIKISVIKKSETNELVLRLVNRSAAKEICTLNCEKNVFETDILENKNIPTNNILYFNPHEIKTVKLK
ncbi:MAG: glycosyl hydrolase-related protein, partial [Candidatus Gastranaerophilaceae bacterium]